MTSLKQSKSLMLAIQVALLACFVAWSLFLSTCVVVWQSSSDELKGWMCFLIEGGQVEVDRGLTYSPVDNYPNTKPGSWFAPVWGHLFRGCAVPIMSAHANGPILIPVNLSDYQHDASCLCWYERPINSSKLLRPRSFRTYS